MKTNNIIIFILVIGAIILFFNVPAFTLPLSTLFSQKPQENTTPLSKSQPPQDTQNTNSISGSPASVNQNSNTSSNSNSNSSINPSTSDILASNSSTAPASSQTSVQAPIVALNNSSPAKKLTTGVVFLEDFKTTYSVVEANKAINRASPGWWLGSGAYFNSESGFGSTIIGPLATNDKFRLEYASSNSIDTDDGYYPQNIFRLVLTRGQWQNFQQEADFKIVNNNLTDSPNRNNSNGLFFFNRYQDADNLYYTGIRVDGVAVIKKKKNGTYYELSQKQFYRDGSYDRATSPNLIPKGKWIGLRSEIITNPDNTVDIKLYIDKDRSGNWVLATEATDNGKSFGGKAITSEGYTGIRTDFMDVQFDNYKVSQESY